MPIYTPTGDLTASDNADLIYVQESTGSGQGNFIHAGGGNDVVVGDHDMVTVDATPANSTLATALSIDNVSAWSVKPNQDISNPNVPYTTVIGGGTGNYDWFQVTLGSAATITLDIDYGSGTLGGPSFDAVVELYDSQGNMIASNDDGSDGGLGSASSLDSFLTHTVGASGFYYVRVRALQQNPVPAGATYVLNVSVTGHGYNDTADFDQDFLYGDAGDDLLQGVDGSDLLYGGQGKDRAYGGAGADSFYDESDNAEDVFLGGDGNDTLYVVSGGGQTTYLDYDGKNVVSAENSSAGWVLDLNGNESHSVGATLLLAAAQVTGAFGSQFEDTIIGHDAGAILYGDDGNDTITGGLGNDSIEGGAGDDVMDGVSGNDTLGYLSANAGVTVRLDTASQQDTGGGGLDTISNFDNLVGSYFDDTLTGNALDNKIEGGFGSDVIQGGLGDDILDGGDGEDTLTYQSASGAVTVSLAILTAQNTGGAGIDKISGFENLRGSNLDDTLIGNANDNIINGGLGADTMKGGIGNDTYYVDNSNDKIVELQGQGGDTVYASASISLAGQYLEALTLTGFASINGSGNGMDNKITGNTGTNILNGGDGNDRLDGGIGADTLIGGLGNDTFVVDQANDKITELDGEGIDTVEASMSYSLAGQYVETLKLMGSGNFNGTGNGLANTLYGNDGNNTLNGGGGADKLYGGIGDDKYVVDDSADKIFELKDEGFDTVESAISFSIAGQFVEALTLTGNAAINGTGNGQDNALTGNSAINSLNGAGGNDHLHGMLGVDVLTGGAGEDLFFFETTLGAANVDKVVDFAEEDTLILDRSIFKAFAASGTIDDAALRIGTAAQDADDRIIYDNTTGNLFYDADGNGSGAAVMFAQLATKPALTWLDFFIVD